MSIYKNPQEYAKQTYMTLEQAIIRCSYFQEVEKAIQRAKKCPKCEAYTLEFESGSYEEGIVDHVYCENDKVPNTDENEENYFNECGFTSVVTEHFQPIQPWYNFDVLLMFSVDIEEKGIEVVEKEIGCSWLEFVDKHLKLDSVIGIFE